MKANIAHPNRFALVFVLFTVWTFPTSVEAEDPIIHPQFSDGCPWRFPSDEGWKAAEQDVLSGQCWSCPIGTERTWSKITEWDACTVDFFSGQTRALFRGFQGGPIGGKNTTPSATGPTVTFYVATDPQIGHEEISSFAISQHVVELNKFANQNTTWPRGASLNPPLAVVMTGDLANTGYDHELTYFRWLYEKENRDTYYNDLVSNQKDHTIRYPVLLGLGNHDTDAFCVTNACAVAMFKYVRIRHAEDPGIASYHGKTGLLEDGSHSYAWVWNGVHYIQLHNFFRSTNFGSIDESKVDRYEHTSAEEWLTNYLQNLPAKTPVVLFQHFPPNLHYSDATWPQKNDVDALAKLLVNSPVNVLAIFAGHTHWYYNERWKYTDSGTGKSFSIPVFVGSTGGTRNTVTSTTSGISTSYSRTTTSPVGHFYVVEVGPSEMKVALAEWQDIPNHAGGTNEPTATAKFVPLKERYNCKPDYQLPCDLKYTVEYSIKMPCESSSTDDIIWRGSNGLVPTGQWAPAGSAAVVSILINRNPAIGRSQCGDVNGDGTDDIIWRHDNGQVFYWSMSSSGQRTGGSDIYHPIGPEWQIRGVGDVNGDGTDDIIWRHDNGQVHYWAMGGGGGGQRIGGYDISDPIGPEWKIGGVGDVNCDGTDDIVWRHKDGQVAYWAMSNGKRGVGSDIGTASGDWEIKDVGDVNGDDTDDIVWQHKNGQVHYWAMSPGGRRTGGYDIHSPVGDWWQIVGVGNVNGTTPRSACF